MEIIRYVFKTFLLCAQKILELLSGKYTFPEFEEELHKLLTELGKNVCGIVLKELDEKIYKDKKERKNWVVLQKDCERTITTKFGDITYKRRYYENKETKEKAYLVDKAAGIQRYERIGIGLKAEIAELSTIMSYGNTVEEIKRNGAECVNISRQTVMNTIKGMDGIKPYEQIKEKRKAEVLYIEADEDHIHYQDGKNGIVKLVYVHEGKESLGEGKNRLKNATYFTGIYEGKEKEELWKAVWEYITSTYEERYIKRIYISGDGAEWIKFGAEYIPDAIYVLDLYHLQKYVTMAFKDEKKLKRALWKAIYKGDLEKVKEIFNDRYNSCKREGEKEAVKRALEYIENNWEGILSYSRYKEEIVGCSAESHVSHVLSERLSRGPISWSKEGAHKMAQLRAVKASGIELREKIIKQRYEGLRPVELPKEIIYKAKQRIKKLNERYGKVTELPILLNKKTFTSMAIKSLLQQSII
jgi:hypothetical protein